MKTITVATHSQAYFPILQESARRNHIELIVIGWGAKWASFGWKLKLLIDYLQTLPVDEIVLIMDAFDTFIVSDMDEITKNISLWINPCFARQSANMIVGFGIGGMKGYSINTVIIHASQHSMAT